jgi:hypothetical protein
LEVILCQKYTPSLRSLYTGTDPGRDAIAGTHLRTNGIKTIIIGRYLSERHSGSKGFGYIKANKLPGRLIPLGSPLHLLSPPEDTFNFTITFNVPAGAPTGSGYDDPIAIREDLKREKVIFRGNTILVAEGYKIEIYSPAGRKIMVLNGGRYEFREIR